MLYVQLMGATRDLSLVVNTLAFLKVSNIGNAFVKSFSYAFITSPVPMIAL